MKVILLTDVSKVGRKYEVKDVSNGYATNYLFRNKLAELATAKKLKELEVLKNRHEDQLKVQADILEKNLESLKGVKVTITAKANEQGHLFQGIHVDEIAEALSTDGKIEVAPSMIVLPQPIKATGEFDITVQVNDNEGTFTLVVDPEK